MTTSIDLSRIQAPALLEALDFEDLQAAFVARFKARWAIARARNPSLPDYDVEMLETDPAIIIGQAVNEVRLLDRQRVNDAGLAVLAPTSRGADLENIAARQNVARLLLVPAIGTTAAIYEDDASLLNRYLLSFDLPAAGSPSRYLLEAWSAWPTMLHARVNGRAIHGRRGETDLVIVGPGGRDATDDEFRAVSRAVRAEDVHPEALAINTIRAIRTTYSARLLIQVPEGPDPSLVKAEAAKRVAQAAAERMKVGGEIPAGYLRAAAFGPSVVDVVDLAPVEIPADPRACPVPVSIEIEPEVIT